MTINATAAILLALYIAVARRRGIAGGVPLRHRAERHPQGVRRARHLHLPAAAVAAPGHRPHRATARSACRAGTRISISGYHIREAGATAAQEIAFTLRPRPRVRARGARRPGLDPGRFGERLSFFFACHSDFIEEVAKFRAARRLWARLVKERLGVVNPKAQHLRFHVQTGGVTLTAQQPDNNVVRVALQALAAVLGGCQSLHTNGKDEALALPTEDVGAPRAAHPAGHRLRVGSGRHRRSAGRLLRGGGGDRRRSRPRLARCSTASRPGAARCARSSAARSSARSRSRPTAHQQARSRQGERVIVGVNRFAAAGEAAPMELLRIDPAVEKAQVERVRALRARRDQANVRRSACGARGAARGSANLMPAAGRRGARLGDGRRDWPRCCAACSANTASSSSSSP